MLSPGNESRLGTFPHFHCQNSVVPVFFFRIPAPTPHIGKYCEENIGEG
jgi:hypothetical protein